MKRISPHNKISFLKTLGIALQGVLVSFGFLLSSAAPAFAVAPTNIITYQGRLLNSNAIPVANTTRSMEFRLYTALTGGTCLWSNSHATCNANTPASTTSRTITLTDGLFTEDLGDTANASPYAAIADTVFGDNADVFLEVEVEGETLTPRKRVAAVAYALNAQTLDGIDSGSFLRDTGDTATGAYDLTGAVMSGTSPLVFEGATANDFETTFVVTEPTADNTITFKNASGTVAFLTDVVASLWEDGTNGVYEDDEGVIVGTDIAETISDAGFALAAGDLFVTDELGVEGDIFTDGDIFLTQESVINFTGGDLQLGSGFIWFGGTDVMLNYSSDQLTIDAGTMIFSGGVDTQFASPVEVNGTLSAFANTDLGDDNTDTLSFVADIDTDLTFDPGATRVITIRPDNTAGDQLSITGHGGGTGNVAGGAIAIAAGVGGTGSTGGAHNGGMLSITGGTGGTDGVGAGTGGTGGDVSMTGGAAGDSGNNVGGNVTLLGGAATGTGAIGIVQVGSPTVGSTRATNLLALGGGLEVDGTSWFDGTLRPGTNDGAALGISGTAFSDLFLASGGVVNFNAGDVTLTWTPTSY